MPNTLRYWIVVLVLAGAFTGLHLFSHGEAVPLSKPLVTLPLEVAGWRGSDFQLEPRIVKGLGVDDYLNRFYEDQSGNHLSIYIGYYKSQRAGVVIHSPKNCLPGSGWQPVTSGYARLVQSNGKSAAVNMYEIRKGLDRQIVLYWYESHGRIIASEYFAKIYMVLDAIHLHRTDAALVRIVTPLSDDRTGSCQRATAFAERILAPLGSLIQ
jgi:EpsI family protein